MEANNIHLNPGDDELLDIVNEQDIVVVKKLRSQIYREGLVNFRVVNAFLVNSQQCLWIPRRTADKKIFPLCLDFSMGGHVESGESYDDALKRELAEELNMQVEDASVRKLGYLTPYHHKVSSFMQVYEIITNQSPNYNRNDFIESFWLNPQQVLDILEKGERALL